MKSHYWENDHIIEFFEEIIARQMYQILPGGRRWIKLPELEKLLDITKEEIFNLVEKGTFMFTTLGDKFMFDYKEICELLENNKFEVAPIDLRRAYEDKEEEDEDTRA